MATDQPTLFDFDSHYYEVRDAFTRYIDEEYRVRSVRFETGPKGENLLYVDNEPLVMAPEWYPPLDQRGSSDAFFNRMLGKAERNHVGDAVSERPEFFSAVPDIWTSRDSRLALLDEQGVDGTLLFPSAGVAWQPQVRDKPDLVAAITRAFNRWLDDDWGYDYQGRIFAVPTIALDDLDQAVDEVDRVLARGARLIALYVSPVGGHSPAATRFDPFWKRVEEAGLPVALHLGVPYDGGHMTELWGEELAPGGDRLQDQSPFLWTTTFCDRPIMDMLASFMYWNLFGRFPELRIVSVEHGAAWVEYFMKSLDKYALFGRRGAWPGGRLEGRPSEIFRHHVTVCPYPEENLVRALGFLGADRLVFGSDYPHPEGLPEPRAILDRLEGIPDDAVQRFLSGNAHDLLGMPAGRDV